MDIVTTHKNTDFDGLASVIAATLIYHEAVPVLPKAVNPNVKDFLSLHKDLFKIYYPGDIDFEVINRLIIVDVAKWERLDGIQKLKNKNGLEIILWDHHPDSGDIVTSWECRGKTGANITLMIQRLKKEKISLTPMQATLFLLGIYEDTGNMMFLSTTPEDASAVSFLLKQKADLNVLANFLKPAYGEKQKNILFEMVQTAQRNRINGYNISVNKITIKGHVDNLAVVVRMYREILNVDAAFGIFLTDKPERCIVIGRSINDGIDIGKIMLSLGGGGHPGAGSAVLKLVNPETVETMLFELIKGNQSTSVQISDIMSFPVFTISPKASMEEVAHILRDKGCTGIPVVDNEKLVGVISRRDFQKIKKDSQLNAPVKAFMSTSVKSIEPGRSPAQAVGLMIKHDIGRLPVVDNGQLVGIITRSDAMIYFYGIMPG